LNKRELSITHWDSLCRYKRNEPLRSITLQKGWRGKILRSHVLFFPLRSGAHRRRNGARYGAFSYYDGNLFFSAWRLMMTRRKKKTLFDELHSFSDVYDVCVKWKHRYLREEVVQPQFKRKTRFTRTRNVLLKQNVVTDRQLLFRIKD